MKTVNQETILQAKGIIKYFTYLAFGKQKDVYEIFE